MKRIFTTLVYLAVGAVIAPAPTGAARACPPVAPAQTFGAGMGYGAPAQFGVNPAGYGLNLSISHSYGGVGAGVPLVPNVGSVGFGGAYGSYGASSAGAFGAAPVGSSTLIVNGRPGLFQRRLIRRQLRRGF